VRFWLRALALAVPVIVLAVFFLMPRRSPEPLVRGGSLFSRSELPFLKSKVGPPPVHPPWITNVKILDFDQDGLSDVLACDARLNCVWWYRQSAGGSWEEHRLGEDILAPAHATVTDLDSDGRNDILVAELGSIWPDDSVIGRVILLQNVSEAGEKSPPRFVKHVLLDDVRRVSDVQAADLNGDGRTDLAVAVFGYDRGEVLWLENMGDLRFRDHSLHSAPGSIHVPLADYNGDGRVDVMTIVSQDEEELWGFENLGDGKFQARRLWSTPNFDLGSAGLVADDLDQDGRVDLILPVGDNLEDINSYPQPYHGCLWFRNLGDWKFEPKRIATFGGTYAAAVGDLNADGHRDVVLVSMFNDWDDARHGSVVWLENDGKQNFRPWQIDERPTHLVTVDCGDLDGDGRDDIVAGGLHLTAPFDRLGRITSWRPASKRTP
jgi:hypothetical protein